MSNSWHTSLPKYPKYNRHNLVGFLQILVETSQCGTLSVCQISLGTDQRIFPTSPGTPNKQLIQELNNYPSLWKQIATNATLYVCQKRAALTEQTIIHKQMLSGKGKGTQTRTHKQKALHLMELDSLMKSIEVNSLRKLSHTASLLSFRFSLLRSLLVFFIPHQMDEKRDDWALGGWLKIELK